MEKRTKAIILIAIGGVAVFLIIVWLFLPLLLRKPNTDQPPSLPTTTQPTTPTPSPVVPSINLPTDGNSPEEIERQAQEKMKQFAMAFAARAGSYGNGDSFEGLNDAKLDAAAEVRSYLDKERARLQKLHPATGSAWGQTAKPVAPRITSVLPVLGKGTGEVTVQTQIITTEEGKETVTYQNAVITMAVLEGGWKATRIEWKAVE
jgi:hypothetical protein